MNLSKEKIKLMILQEDSKKQERKIKMTWIDWLDKKEKWELNWKKMMSETTKESKILHHSMKLNFNKKDKIIQKAKEIFKNFIPTKLTVSKKSLRLKNKRLEDFLKSTGNWSKMKKKDWLILFQTIMSWKEKSKILSFIMKEKLS